MHSSKTRCFLLNIFSPCQELHAAFPSHRRDIASLPDAGLGLQDKPFEEMRATPFGQALEVWLQEVLRLEIFLDRSIPLVWLGLVG